MIIDCDSCEVRGNACGDCVIGVLLDTSSPRPGPGLSSRAAIVQLDASERRALDVLADQGLVPRLRLAAPASCRATPDGDRPRVVRDVPDGDTPRDVRDVG
ncbi:MAG: hypothetical protein ACRDRH_00370 [Pseudonocardia sp.]